MLRVFLKWVESHCRNHSIQAAFSSNKIPAEPLRLLRSPSLSLSLSLSVSVCLSVSLSPLRVGIFFNRKPPTVLQLPYSTLGLGLLSPALTLHQFTHIPPTADKRLWKVRVSLMCHREGAQGMVGD